jgi:formate/nitrite transporter
MWETVLNTKQKKENDFAEDGNKYEPTLSPDEVRGKISALGIKKANTKVWQLALLGILAGLYIGFGGHAYLVAIQQGMGKIVGGAVFSTGLILVVIGGAELFTGNIIMIVSTVISFKMILKILKNWIVVYSGNFIGSIVFAVLIWYSGLLGSAEAINSLGETAIKIAEAKMSISFGQAFIRGIFCNILVILAIILATIPKDVISKIFCCIMPIMVFVASGFEHCIANMFLIPVGLLAKGLNGIELFIMFDNIIPVTLGNMVGGIFILTVHPNRIRQLVYLIKNKHIFR